MSKSFYKIFTWLSQPSMQNFEWKLSLVSMVQRILVYCVPVSYKGYLIILRPRYFMVLY